MDALRRKRSCYTYCSVLSWIRGDVFEGPLDVLVHGQLSGKGPRLLTAHAENAVVRRQHATVEQHHVLVVMVSSERIQIHISTNSIVMVCVSVITLI